MIDPELGHVADSHIVILTGNCIDRYKCNYFNSIRDVSHLVCPSLSNEPTGTKAEWWVSFFKSNWNRALVCVNGNTNEEVEVTTVRKNNIILAVMTNFFPLTTHWTLKRKDQQRAVTPCTSDSVINQCWLSLSGILLKVGWWYTQFNLLPSNPQPS